MLSIMRIAWRNVLRNWRHSLSTLLSISMGFLAIMLFKGYIEELFAWSDAFIPKRGMLGHVVVEKKNARSSMGKEDAFAFQLSEDEQAKIDAFLQTRQQDVLGRVRFLGLSGMVNNGKTNAIFVGYGFDVTDGRKLRGERWDWNTFLGKPLFDDTENAVLLGKDLAGLLDCQNEPQETYLKSDGSYIPVERPFTCPRKRIQLMATTVSAQVNALDAEINGLTFIGLRELDNKFVTMPLAMAQSLLDTKNVSYYTVELHDERKAPEFIKSMKSALALQGLDLDVQHWKDHEFGTLHRQSRSVLDIFEQFVSIVVFAVVLLAIANTIMRSVGERTREIGTLRSIGYLQREIIWLFAFEACFLAVLSLAIGCILLVAIIIGVNSADISYKAGGIASEPFPLLLSFQGLFGIRVVLLFCVIAMLSSFVASRKAARRSVAEALAAN